MKEKTEIIYGLNPTYQTSKQNLELKINKPAYRTDKQRYYAELKFHSCYYTIKENSTTYHRPGYKKTTKKDIVKYFNVNPQYAYKFESFSLACNYNNMDELFRDNSDVSFVHAGFAKKEYCLIKIEYPDNSYMPQSKYDLLRKIRKCGLFDEDYLETIEDEFLFNFIYAISDTCIYILINPLYIKSIDKYHLNFDKYIELSLHLYHAFSMKKLNKDDINFFINTIHDKEQTFVKNPYNENNNDFAISNIIYNHNFFILYNNYSVISKNKYFTKKDFKDILQEIKTHRNKTEIFAYLAALDIKKSNEYLFGDFNTNQDVFIDQICNRLNYYKQINPDYKELNYNQLKKLSYHVMKNDRIKLYQPFTQSQRFVSRLKEFHKKVINYNNITKLIEKNKDITINEISKELNLSVSSIYKYTKLSYKILKDEYLNKYKNFYLVTYEGLSDVISFLNLFFQEIFVAASDFFSLDKVVIKDVNILLYNYITDYKPKNKTFKIYKNNTKNNKKSDLSWIDEMIRDLERL